MTRQAPGIEEGAAKEQEERQADMCDLAPFCRNIWGQLLSLCLARLAAHLPSSGTLSPGTFLARDHTDV